MDINDIYYDHLKPTKLKDKELFVNASLDIQHSFTGRLDMLGLHIFFIEAATMIRNAVKLYEEGFFDAAFYSVRCAVELARVVTYFSKDDNPQDSDVFKGWATGGKFPFDSTIKTELEKSSSTYQEVREVLSDFFDGQSANLKKYQKYIHKQGFRSFYERGFTNKDREEARLKRITDDFVSFTKNSLAEIALLRLCVDPFPLLLRDPDVKYKIHAEWMTEAFSDQMVDSIIGKSKIKLYCSTDFYKSHVEYFVDNEILSEEAHTLINDQFYDRATWSIIKSQLQLLSSGDMLAVKVFNTSKKIAKIYMFNGMMFYFSDIKSSRKNMGFSGLDLIKLKESKQKLNQPYDEAYLSYLLLGDEDVWVEHNGMLTKAELTKLQSIDTSSTSDPDS